MRLAAGIALCSLLACLPPAHSSSYFAGEQDSLPGATIIVSSGRVKTQLLDVPVEIRVHSLKGESLLITVEELSAVAFHELAAGEYRIDVSARGYEPAQANVTIDQGQTVRFTLSAKSGALDLQIEPAPLAFGEQHRETGTALGRAMPVTSPGKSSGVTDKRNSCPMDEVVFRASKRLEEFVENVNRITAIELLEHERLDKHGKVLEQERHQFNYVAVIQETEPGALNVDEYRDGGVGANGGFPHDIATVGMPSLAMIFHPYHLSEFAMTCAGGAVWHDRPAWQVHFQQRRDQPARMSSLRVGHEIFAVLLKGTAWIDTENYQIVHLETDLLESIPKVRLVIEHQALDYGPVEFQNRKVSMWLPQQAEIYLDSGGRHFHHRHLYSKYRIFSVDVGQKIGSPK